jgi:PAS domain S-box-containing protein
VALFGAALAARFSLVGVLPDQGFPFLTFFPAVLLSVFLAGFGPGLLTAALSMVAAWYFFIPPSGRFGHLSAPDGVALVFFSAVLLVECIVIDLMNRALDSVHRTQRLLRASEHRVRNVLDKLFVAAGVLDLDGTLRELNEASAQWGVVDRQAAVGRKFWDLPWWQGDAARQSRVQAAITRAAQGETVRLDVELDGEAPAHCTVDFQVAPLHDPEGRIVALVACGVDVTSRMQALADLERSRAQALEAASAAERERRVLDATFNAVPAGIIVADATGRLVRMNQATERIWGIAPYSVDVAGYGEWKGWWAGDSPHAGQRIAPHEWGLARSLRGEHCTDVVEVEPFGRPHKRLVTQLSSAPVLDPQGQVVGGVVVQVDITARIEAERALREADRQKDTFLATLSHELRNPLAPIRAGAHIIALSPLADERMRRAAAVIERQSALLTRLVDDLLDVSRLKFGSLVLQTARVDVRRVVEAAVETSRPQIDVAGHDLQLHLPDAPLMVEVDEARLAQCISNLLNNACKFTPHGGRVTLDVRPLGDDRVGVRITDTGQGIAPDMLGKIFELFAQERRSGMGGNTGLGIGLALTRRLVQMQGGEITVHSEGPGRGACFEIVLPLAGPVPDAVGSH